MENEVGRRGFLAGLIGSIGAGKVILEASDADIARYGTKAGDAAIVQRGNIDKIPQPKWGTDFTHAVNQGAMPGGMWLLYNFAGEAVAAVRNYKLHDPTEVGQGDFRHLTADIDCVPVGERGCKWLQEMGAREFMLRANGRK